MSSAAVITIKYKLVGGPYHGQVFYDTALPPLLYVYGPEGEHYYKFNEMRGHNYYVYTFVNACGTVDLVSVMARENTRTLSRQTQGS